MTLWDKVIGSLIYLTGGIVMTAIFPPAGIVFLIFVIGGILAPDPRRHQ